MTTYAVRAAGIGLALMLTATACGDDADAAGGAGTGSSSSPTATAVDPEAADGTSEVASEGGDGTGGAVPVTDACALLSADDLRRVFPADDPTAEGNDFGAGFWECIWTGKNAQASVAVLPKADLAEDYTDKMTPFDTAADLDELADAGAYEGSIGIGRFSGKGTTVIFTKGEYGVLVAVRTGPDGSKPVDVGAAAELAREVNDRL